MGYYNEAILKHMMINVAQEGKEEYQKFFNQAMKKFGIKSPQELDSSKKKDFFNYIDKNYDAKNEDVDESTKAYAKTLAKMAKDRQLKNISKKDKQLLSRIAQMMKTANEGKLSSKVKKAIMLAIGMSGNMTGAVKKIEKMAKGLAKHPKVQDALRLANENVNEGITVSGYSQLSKRGRHMPLAAKEFVKALKKQDDKEVIKNIEYMSDLVDYLKDTLKEKRFNENKINENIDKAYDDLHDALVYTDKMLKQKGYKKEHRKFKQWWNELDGFYPSMQGEVKEALHPYKDFDGFPKEEYDLNLGAFVEHYQDFIKFMKKHKEVPDKNKREWALAIRNKVGRGMFNGHMSQMSNIMDLLQMGDKFRNLKEGLMNEKVGDQHVVAIKDFIDSAMKKAGIKVKKIKPMKRGMTRAIYGAFYTVKAASGNDILPVYVYKTGKIELGVSSAGFWPGKYGDMSRVVNQLKDFKRTDLDNKD
tara:strand:- start:14880 stop:16301 length:1422 start_codon:yes stop_codon:yes gene_type:complete